jgi:hypothetical protein
MELDEQIRLSQLDNELELIETPVTNNETETPTHNNELELIETPVTNNETETPTHELSLDEILEKIKQMEQNEVTECVFNVFYNDYDDFVNDL